MKAEIAASKRNKPSINQTPKQALLNDMRFHEWAVVRLLRASDPSGPICTCLYVSLRTVLCASSVCHDKKFNLALVLCSTDVDKAGYVRYVRRTDRTANLTDLYRDTLARNAKLQPIPTPTPCHQHKYSYCICSIAAYSKSI